MLTVTILLCGIFGILLRIYCEPMNGQIYGISLGWDGEAIPDDWVYDQKGWRVYVQEGDTARDLEPVWTPYLAAEYGKPCLSLFLDGTLIYNRLPGAALSGLLPGGASASAPAPGLRGEDLDYRPIHRPGDGKRPDRDPLRRDSDL